MGHWGAIGFSADPCQLVNRLQAGCRMLLLRLGETLQGWWWRRSELKPCQILLVSRRRAARPGQTARVPGQDPGLLVMTADWPVMRESWTGARPPFWRKPVYCFWSRNTEQLSDFLQVFNNFFRCPSLTPTVQRVHLLSLCQEIVNSRVTNCWIEPH